MIGRRSQLIVAFTVVALIASGALAQSEREASLLGDAISVTELFPKSEHEQSLAIELGLKVETVEMKNGAVKLRTTSRVEPGDSSILEVTPDLETRTYTATRVAVTPEALEKLGFLPPNNDRISSPFEKIFGVNTCVHAQVLLRSHSGNAGVIRSTTATSATWQFSDSHGLNCMDLYGKSATCNPAFGMLKLSCNVQGNDDGVSTASVTSNGNYAGDPPGSPTIGISDTTAISITRLFAIVTTVNGIAPSSEPLGIQAIVTSFEVNCPFSA